MIGLWRAARAEAEGHRPGPSRRAWRSAQVAAAVGIALVVVTFLVVGVWHPWQPGQVAGGHADLTSTDPAATNGALRCMRVTASRDVRVFTSETTEETWTTWPHDTRFVVDGISRNQKRYRTPLRNGRHGWVTSDPQYVAESGDCGAIG